MARSGDRVDLGHIPGIKVGKHSTGGVGDKVSIVLAPLAAACGVIVPKMSGRGLGHTGGTLDKLESIPGFRVALSLDEYKAQLADVGCCLISQTETIAPADKTLYALRDVTGTIESLPLIASSVMSKKLAEGSNALVLDVKCGRGAFMKRPADARALARSMVAIGTAAGVRTEAFITRMDVPLGRAVGNAVEIAECIEVLSGRGPADLIELIVRLGSRMVRLASWRRPMTTPTPWCEQALVVGGRAREVPRDGRAAGRRPGRGGRSRRACRRPRSTHAVPAAARGFVTALDALLVGRAAVALGAGRDKKGDRVDLSAGIMLHKKPGEAVQAGEPVVELRYNDRGAPAGGGGAGDAGRRDRRAAAGRRAAGARLGARQRRDDVRRRNVAARMQGARCQGADVGMRVTWSAEHAATADRAGRHSRAGLRACRPTAAPSACAWSAGGSACRCCSP